jgi:hypothetical protein
MKKVNLYSAQNFILHNMKERKEEAASVGRKVKYGMYDELVRRARVTFNFPKDVPLKKRCLHPVNRKDRSVLVAHHGKISPMIQVKAHLVDIILHYSRMQQPITPKVGLALVNSMIKGAEIEQEMIMAKKKNLPNSMVGKQDPNFQVAVHGDEILCNGWWQNFLKCNPSITSKKAVCFDSMREDCCSVKIFEVMYEEVYESMVGSGVAVKLDEEVYVDAEGNVVDEQDGFGRKMKYLATRPNYILHVDEVENNTLQKMIEM